MTGTRILEFDLMRGVALIGIFVMNIIAMAYPIEAYLNPLAFDASNWLLSIEERTHLTWRWDDTIFSILYVFVYQKMIFLFACLFGVSALIILESEQSKKLKHYFARNLWMFLFGCLHLLFLFYGDILWVYSLCALILWLFAFCSAGVLIPLSIFLYAVGIFVLFDYQQTITLFSAQQLLELQNLWIPQAEWIVDAVKIAQDPVNKFPLAYHVCLECIENESAVVSQYYSVFTKATFLQIFALMLLGMGLYKLGFLPSLTKEGLLKPKRFNHKIYRMIAFYGLSLGFCLSLVGLLLNYFHHWNFEFSVAQGGLLASIAAPIMLLAYISLLLLWCQSDSFQRVKLIIQTMGRMALTNYILQSVLGVLLFTGFGLGYFGELNRIQLLMLAVMVCCLLAMFSILWMKYFYYGPLEWVWRSLSKFRIAKLRRSAL